MKPSTALALAAALLAAAQSPEALAQAAAPSCATVRVDNVRPQTGYLMVAAYADADSFSKKPLTSLRLPAGEAVMSFQLCGLRGTEVALTLFQDFDGDGRMNRNLLGMPTEPWGSSGRPGSFGPTWDTARVPLDGQPIAVRMAL